MAPRIGINEIVLNDRPSGTRQREINLLPALLRELRSVGWQSLVYLASDLGDMTASRLLDGETPVVVRSPIPSSPTYARIARGIAYWRKRCRQDRLDLFHMAYYPVPNIDVPLVLTVNDLRFVHMPDTYSPARLWFLRATVGSSIKRANRIIAISGDTRNDLVRHFNVAPELIDVVHIPADPAFCRVTDPHRLESVRRRHRLPDKYVLYVGHLEPRKNLVRLVQAFAALHAENAIDHDLVILGNPSLRFQAILDSAKAVSCANRIVFAGGVEDVDLPAVYSMADLLAFPSLHEGFGMPLLEAMACRIPIVASNAGALPEIAAGSARMVDPCSVDSIAAGLLDVARNETLRRQLVESGARRLLDFSPEAAARKIRETYENTLS